MSALSFCFPQALEVLAKAATQRQEEESAPKDRSGVVKKTAQVTEKPKTQPEEEEPPTPEDNRAHVPLGPSGPPQVMSQELIRGLAEATSNMAFGQTLLGQGSTASPQGASRSTGPPPSPPSLSKGKGKGKGKGSRVSLYPPRGGRAPASQQPVVIAPQGSSTAQGSGIPQKLCIRSPITPGIPPGPNFLTAGTCWGGGAVPRWSGVPSLEGLQMHQEPQVGRQVEWFSNAKTLGTHLRCFHNIELASMHHPTNPQPILEDPTCHIAP